MALFQQYDQIGRCAGLEPIIAKLIIFKCIEQAKRVVDAYRIFHKMITVVIHLEFNTNILVGHVLEFCQLMDLFFQIIVYFLFGNSAEIDIRFAHGNVVQVVQITEYAYFSKFGHSRQHSKLNMAIR